MNTNTNTKLVKSGLTILLIVSIVLTAKFCFDIGCGAGWPVMWAAAGVAFELVKCRAIQSGISNWVCDFNRAAVSAVLAGVLMLFSAAASFNVLSNGLSDHVSASGSRQLLQQKIDDLKIGINDSRREAEILTARERVTAAQRLIEQQIKPAQEQLYLLEQQKQNIKPNFIGDHALDLAAAIAGLIEMLALYCSYELYNTAKDNTDSAKYNNNIQNITEYNNNIQNITEYNAVIDADLYSEIKADICNGYIKPTHSALSKHYDLRQQEIQMYLSAMAAEGVLVQSGKAAIRYYLA